MSFDSLFDQIHNKNPKVSGNSFDSLFDQASKSKKPGWKQGNRLHAQGTLAAADLALFPLTLQSDVTSSEDAQHAEFRKGIFEDIERLAEQKQTGVWDEQDEELFQQLQEQIKNPEKAEPFVQTADIRPSHLAKKGIKEFTGEDLEPRNAAEHIVEFAGNVIKPKSLIKGVEYLASKELRQTIKLQKNWDRLSRAAAKSPEKQTLLNFAKQKELSPEATNLLFHSEGRAEYLATIGRKTKKFKGAVEELNKKLGKNYNELKALGEQGGHLNLQEADALMGDLGKVLEEMKGAPYIGAEVSPVINSLEKSIENINNKTNSVKELIESRINLSSDINWRNFEKGDFYRNEARQAFFNAIERKNPAVAERLANTDRAWAKYEKFKDVLDAKIPTMNIKGVKAPVSLVEALAFGVAPFIPVLGKGAAVAVALKIAVQRLATQMAINPKYNKPLKHLQAAMLEGRPEKIKKDYMAIKAITKKEDPDIYEEIKDLDFD